MRRILIVSDTHGRLGNFKEMLRRTGTPDRLIHLGDGEGQHEKIAQLAGCPADFVKGNCDWYEDLPDKKLTEIGKYRAFLTHGHQYMVRYGVQSVVSAAKKNGADIVMFGHTHVPVITEVSGVTVLNPGSLTFPRQADFKYTYILMELDNDGEAHYTLCSL